MDCFVNDHKLNGERFELLCFVIVCGCTSLAPAELSYNFTFQVFFTVKKRDYFSLIFIFVLLENSRRILTATALDSTDSKCISSANCHL